MNHDMHDKCTRSPHIILPLNMRLHPLVDLFVLFKRLLCVCNSLFALLKFVLDCLFWQHLLHVSIFQLLAAPAVSGVHVRVIIKASRIAFLIVGRCHARKFTKLFKFPSVQHTVDVESLCGDSSDEKCRNDVGEDHIGSKSLQDAMNPSCEQEVLLTKLWKCGYLAWVIRPPQAKPKDSFLEFPVFYSHLDTAELQLQHLVNIPHGVKTRNSVSLHQMHIGSLRIDLISEFYTEALRRLVFWFLMLPTNFPWSKN